MAVALSVISAVLFGTADFAGGFAGRSNRVPAVVFFSQLAGLALAVVFSLLNPAVLVRVSDLGWGAAAGIAGLIGLIALYYGLAHGRVAVVSPISALIGVLVPVLFGFLVGERSSALATVGMVITVPAIVLLTVQFDFGRVANVREMDPRVLRLSIITAVVSGVAFGLFFILIAGSGDQSGLWPLVAARGASLTAVLLYFTVSRTAPSVRPASLPVILAVGLMDMGANILFLAATRIGLLMLVSLATGVYPIPTVVLARVVFRERIGRQRFLGLCCAVVGVALMSAG